MVGTYRTEEAGAALRALLETPGTVRTELGRLDERAVGRMIGDMLALEPPPELFSRHLARHSEGNPFFVAEYLRAAVAEGLLYRDAEGRWQVQEPGSRKSGVGSRRDQRATAADYERLPLPGNLRELVGRRLAGLGRGAQQLANACSVLGRESDLAVVARMVRLDEARLHDALLELQQRQVLEVAAPSAAASRLPTSDFRLPRVRFVHDKIREVAHASLRRPRRKTLHRAAAEAIAGPQGHAAAAAEQQAALGHHWEQAGEPAQARPCYLAAARHAVER